MNLWLVPVGIACFEELTAALRVLTREEAMPEGLNNVGEKRRAGLGRPTDPPLRHTAFIDRLPGYVNSRKTFQVASVVSAEAAGERQAGRFE
jgi:hypothetical protein